MERRVHQRGRTLLSAKVAFHKGRSAIDCVVRNLSDGGCCIEVATPLGIPDTFDLSIVGERAARSCKVVWRSNRRLGLSFLESKVVSLPESPGQTVDARPLALQAALDAVDYGVLLVDQQLHAEFMNKVFRRIWRVPDAMASQNPSLEQLIYHGRDARSDWSDEVTTEYVANRLALVRAGNTTPSDIRLANGEVIRLQCAVLPNGGRMLTYTYVTDFIRRSDELNFLRAALDQVPEGIVLLDADFNAQFMNRAVRRLWHVSDEQAETKPPYEVLVGDSRYTGAYGIAPHDLDRFINDRIERIKSADPAPQTLRTGDGREILSQCAVLPSGGRMLTYWDVSEFIRNGERLQQLANTDPVTGIPNRRNFLAVCETEWERFQRYSRPLTILMMDVDNFKTINDSFGHATGDAVLSAIAEACTESMRVIDTAARFGGDEFALLLPETDVDQAVVVAERIRANISRAEMFSESNPISISISIGVAAATLSMSGIHSLLQSADAAMYKAKISGKNQIAIGTPDRSKAIDRAAE